MKHNSKWSYKLDSSPTVGAKNVHSKVSHSKLDSMSSEYLDASLELPIHGVQESVFQVQGLSVEPYEYSSC